MNMFSDNIVIDSPINTIKTPVIIGFLTCPYKSLIISFLVGLQGAKVPFPILMNIEIVLIIRYNPMNIMERPARRAEK